MYKSIKFLKFGYFFCLEAFYCGRIMVECEVKGMKAVDKKNKGEKNKNIQSAKKSVSKKKETEQQPKKEKLKGPDLQELGYEIKKDIKEKKHFSKKLLVLVISLILLIIIFIGMYFLTPKIYLNGSKEVEISYGDTYIEQGAKVKYLNKELKEEIQIINHVNTDKVGTYEVEYKVKYKFYKIKKIRVVHVVDKKSPTITLEGENEVNVCPNKEFEELGYTAIDEYDGNITDQVKVTQEKDKVVYTVKDSSGNSNSITRKINKVDKESPIITLKGNTTMYLTLEDDFKEPGYTATDNCSGDLTDKVIVTGSVQAKKKGTYTLTYEVLDSSNNKATVQRKVIVSEKTDPNSGIVKNGTIYLTFDDGPSSLTTGAILDVLKEEGVKATFFITNNGPDHLIKRMYDEGHTIAIHTASHEYSKVYSSRDNYFADLKIVSDRIKRITGQTSKIVRFPGGSSNTISRRYCKGIMTQLSGELFNQGYRYYDWNVDSGDASTSKTKEAVYNKVTSNLSKSRVNMVLMHDIKYQTRDAIRDIIRYGKENGYTFDRIDMDTYMVRQKINN